MRQPGNLVARHFFSQALLSPKTQKMPGELTTEKNVKCLGKCGSKWHFLPGTFWKYKMCLGTCGCKEHFFARHFLWTFWISVKLPYLHSSALLVKCYDLLLLTNFAKLVIIYAFFVAFWWNIVIYALCRILVKCSDLRIFPSKKFRIPGTKNYYAALLAASTHGSWAARHSLLRAFWYFK